MWLFYYFHFEKNYDILKSKSPCILLNKNITFNKNETESKMENLTQSFEGQTLCFSSFKNRKLKIKLWSVGAHEKKKRAFFVLSILSKKDFFNICVLSQCMVYWIHFLNIQAFTYQKTLVPTLFLLVFKTIESLQCILKYYSQ